MRVYGVLNKSFPTMGLLVYMGQMVLLLIFRFQIISDGPTSIVSNSKCITNGLLLIIQVSSPSRCSTSAVSHPQCIFDGSNTSNSKSQVDPDGSTSAGSSSNP